MRRLAVAMVMMAAAHSAQAADMPDFADLPILRGAFRETPNAPVRNWSGFYAGGQIGYAAPAMDFSRASSSSTGFLMRNSVLQPYVSNWSLLGKNDIQSTSFGGFAGRNWQWDDVVLGVEANYNHLSKASTSSVNSMSRSITNPTGEFIPPDHVYTHNITLAGGAAMAVHDVMTFRARAGWAASIFLPYMFGGVAVARVDDSRYVSITGNLVDVYTPAPPTPGSTTVTPRTPLSQSEARTNNFIFGYTAGLGTEVALTRNVFARVEWEYVKFATIKDISLSINTVRGGVGYRF